MISAVSPTNHFLSLPGTRRTIRHAPGAPVNRSAPAPLSLLRALPRRRVKITITSGKPQPASPTDPVVDVSRAVRNAELASIDGAVRAHEQAHLAALGVYAQTGAEYDYLITADGRRYAVGGSVSVNLQPVPGDPEATIRKARALIMAAYSPTSPSGPDMRVAAEAYRMEMEAVRQLERKEEMQKDEEPGIDILA
jgi:hypothetical protein